MAEYLIQDSSLTAIADAIRGKTSDPATMKPTEFSEKISGIETGREAEAVNVVSDLADGDQVVSPSADDKVLSQVTIQKPETLVPGNIAEGVSIAGVVGALAAGGVNVKCAFGTFTGTGNMLTVEHNLGVVPDVLFVYKIVKTASTTLLAIDSAFGVSSALATMFSLPWTQAATYSKKNGNYYETYLNNCTSVTGSIDSTGASYGPGMFSNVNETSFKIGISLNINQWKCESGVEYKWLAIGGLT